MRRTTLFLLTLTILVPLLIVAQQTTEKVDLNVIHKIKEAELGGVGAEDAEETDAAGRKSWRRCTT